MNHYQKNDLLAFLLALGEVESLPEELTQKLNALGVAFQQNQLEGISEIPALAAMDSTLLAAYNAKLQALIAAQAELERPIRPPEEEPSYADPGYLINKAADIFQAENISEKAQDERRNIDQIPEVSILTRPM
ncbi:MAG TPA: hypothetical protein IGS52_15805 [Oscillatoriaceae cyanobacterium M33_DOE_052]|uniref:Uncharacterized protein n=1 Tax=Planktothricoides sp. SpSt-374 TaxID=2282167 RepID=A0A7C3VEX1_9CYAN|nr:hypothetical protein [Oscillatoriaceae cyanobacterium M33_DOE_052]